MLSFFAATALLSWFSGCASKPPTALEQRWFTVTTNPPVLAVVTNVFQVTQFKTNEVTLTVTNTQGVTEFKTNVTIVPVSVTQTNVGFVTNTPETYNFAPNQNARNVGEVGGAVGNLFGVGGLVTTGIGVLFSLWGYVRSKKSNVTAANIAQTVETMREFIKGLPNGAAYDNELVNWMQAHQAEQGVLNQVLNLLATQVSNADARVAADQVRATLAALGTTMPTPPPPKS